MFDKIEGHALDEIIEVVEEHGETVVKAMIDRTPRKPDPLPV
jgi:uncharacterized protein YqgV (UPF0045/DUF77 family)